MSTWASKVAGALVFADHGMEREFENGCLVEASIPSSSFLCSLRFFFEILLLSPESAPPILS